MSRRAPVRPRPAGSRLAAVSLSRPGVTLAVLAVLFAVGGVLGGPVAGLLKGGGFNDPHSESSLASAAMLRATGVPVDSSVVVLVRAGEPVSAGAGRDLVSGIAGRLAREPQVVQVVDPYAPPDPALVSRDGREAYLVATLAARPQPTEDAARDIAADLQRDPRVLVGGYLIADRQVGDQVSKDIGRAEIVAFPILLAVLVVVLRGLVVALLPVAVGGLTILTTFLGLRLVNDYGTDLSIFAVNLVTGLGLGLAIDYGLLIVNRYREEARVDGYGRPAMTRTLGTAGRTVLFSSMTVAAAAGALIVFPQRFLYSMGIGGLIGAPLGAATALTLLPAALVLLGPRVERLGWYRLAADRGPADRGLWYRLSRLVMRRPVAVALATGALLVALGTPFLRISFTSVDASVLPQSATGRQVDDALRHDFPTDTSSPLRVVVQAPAASRPEQALAAFTRSVAAMPDVRAVQPPQRLDATTWLVNVVSDQPALSDASQRLVAGVRQAARALPGTALVGGAAAEFTDLQHSLASHLPAAVGLIAGITILILFVMTGSVVLPVKAVLMNALSLSAAFGILVLVFQDGRLTSLLRYEPQGGLESTQPILLFAIAFGLSTDYGVFLLQRIKEAHDRGLPTAEAVAVGMERTGRIVTAAALLFCIAIGAFASSSIVFIKEVGMGTALAVALDASIVRALLVPSLMALLRDWNWWAPPPLRALHRRLRLDRLEHAERPEAAPAAA